MERIDLSRRPRNRGDLEQWYAAVLEDQATSGLSVTDYADELGVTATTLYQWRRRLSTSDPSEPELERQPTTGLVEVMVQRAPVATQEPSFVVRLGQDRGIEVPSRFDATELQRLITVVESC